eukprot:COSAG02_NODE_34_length_49821_cov_105.420438_31_plen_107_part_00
MWLVAIRPSSSVARPRNRRSVVGMRLKGGLVGCGHELRRRHRRLGGRSWVARQAVFGQFLLHAMGLHADLFGCCCRFYAGRLGYIPVVDRRSSFGCVRSVVCMQEG